MFQLSKSLIRNFSKRLNVFSTGKESKSNKFNIEIVKLENLQKTSGGVDVVVVCKNERKLLPYFIEYYQKIGVERLFILDNNSDDGTFEYLKEVPNINLFTCKENYAEAQHGNYWANYLIDEYMHKRWVLYVDIDELILFPGIEKMSINTFTSVLDSMNLEGLFCLMIDFYSDTQSEYIEGTSFEKTANFFDHKGYSFFPSKGLKDASPKFSSKGGMRTRMFSFEGVRSPVLRKVPLVKANVKSPYVSAHAVKSCSLGHFSGCLMHFKFLGKTAADIQRDVDSNGRGKLNVHYQLYANGLAEKANKSFICEEFSAEFKSNNQLLELGLMTISKAGLSACEALLKEVMPEREREEWKDEIKKSLAVRDEAFPFTAEIKNVQFPLVPAEGFQLTDKF